MRSQGLGNCQKSSSGKSSVERRLDWIENWLRKNAGATQADVDLALQREGLLALDASAFGAMANLIAQGRVARRGERFYLLGQDDALRTEGIGGAAPKPPVGGRMLPPTTPSIRSVGDGAMEQLEPGGVAAGKSPGSPLKQGEPISPCSASETIQALLGELG